MEGRLVAGLAVLLWMAQGGCAPARPPSENPVARGAALYGAICAPCHGEVGRGGLGRAPPLDASGHAWHHPDQQMRDWIINGKLGLDGGMPPNRDRVTTGDVPALLAYLKTLWTEEQRASQEDITRRYEEGLRKYR